MSLTSFDETVELSIFTYLQWLESLELIEHLKGHLFPEKLFFERKWAEQGIPLFQDIFSFLKEKEILIDEGGAVSITRKGLKCLEKAEKTNIPLSNPVYNYLMIGLEKLTQILNHDENKFEIDRDCFLLENAFTYPYRVDLIPKLKEIYRNELKLERLPKVALVGNFVEWFLPSIVDLIETPDQVSLIVPTDLAVERGIGFAELDERTAIFSPNFYTYGNPPEERFDLVFHFFAFGFDVEPFSLMNLLVGLLQKRGYLIGIFPFGLERCGIEPLFPIINEWTGKFPLEKVIVYFEDEKNEKFLKILRN